jgi:hypothetical protein
MEYVVLMVWRRNKHNDWGVPFSPSVSFSVFSIWGKKLVHNFCYHCLQLGNYKCVVYMFRFTCKVGCLQFNIRNVCVCVYGREN